MCHWCSGAAFERTPTPHVFVRPSAWVVREINTLPSYYIALMACLSPGKWKKKNHRLEKKTERKRADSVRFIVRRKIYNI
jgi:hypothetical protein